MKTYRVALVGMGMIMSGAHIPAIEHLGGRMQIVAVCDEREQAAPTCSSATGLRAILC